jgi:hypothetical protein
MVTRASVLLQAQAVYDSISISRCTIGIELTDKLKPGEFRKYINHERTIWVRPTDSNEQVMPAVLSLTDEIRNNGTQDVARCFIPRHSINFYEKGIITRFLLICFQCDGVHFNDDPKVMFVKSLDTRDEQMLKLKKLFKDLL